MVPTAHTSAGTLTGVETGFTYVETAINAGVLGKWRFGLRRRAQLPKPARELLAAMMAPKPTERVTAKAAFAMEWLKVG